MCVHKRNLTSDSDVPAHLTALISCLFVLIISVCRTVMLICVCSKVFSSSSSLSVYINDAL